MATGFLVRLRPTGPWRIGPDSGARDRVETIYHSDSMYSAVTSAMVRLGMLEEWLAATAGSEEGSAVRFSSCYPFQRKTLFVAPPATVWPPPPSTKIRYKGARFVPLSMVSSLLADQPVDESRWLLDGASECLLPSDRNEGPFRVVLRTAAAIDRLTPGACETHTTACLEFAQGCGLWFLVGFASPEARSKWAGPVKTALRLLADTGFGGERSQGWGRSEMPEFIDGDLKHLVLPPRRPKPAVPAPPPAPAPAIAAAVIEPPPVAELQAPVEEEPAQSETHAQAEVEATAVEAETAEPVHDPEAVTEETPAEEAPAIETPETNAGEEGALEPADGEPPVDEPAPEAPAAVLVEETTAEEPAPAEPAPPVEAVEETDITEQASEPAPDEPAEPVEAGPQGWWLLSLFSPGRADQVDWSRGKYALVVRSGRVESAARHGDLKTPASMIQEGSVLVAEGEPHGAARDVAPDGFPHPVYRAGFALAIPIPVRGTP